MVKLLLAKGANLEAMDKIGNTALTKAVTDGNTDMVKLLLENRAITGARDKSGETPLISAVDQGKSDIAKMLIETGANLNTYDREGRTALMVAAEQGNADIVHTLLRRYPRGFPTHSKLRLKSTDGLGAHVDSCTPPRLRRKIGAQSKAAIDYVAWLDSRVILRATV